MYSGDLGGADLHSRFRMQAVHEGSNSSPLRGFASSPGCLCLRHFAALEWALNILVDIPCTVSWCLKIQISIPILLSSFTPNGAVCKWSSQPRRQTWHRMADLPALYLTHRLNLPVMWAGPNPALWRPSVDGPIRVFWITLGLFPTKWHSSLRRKSAELLQWPLEFGPVCSKHGRISLKYLRLTAVCYLEHCSCFSLSFCVSFGNFCQVYRFF